MAITIVQQTTLAVATTAAATLTTSNFGSPVTGGNSLIVIVAGAGANSGNGGTITVGDTQSNSYTWDSFAYYNSGSASTVADPGSTTLPATCDCIGICHAQNVTGGSSFNVTVTAHGSGITYKWLIIAIEVSGLGSTVTLDSGATDANANTTGSNENAGTFSTANANDIIFLAYWAAAGVTSGGVNTAPSGYTMTNFTRNATTAPCGAAAYAIVSSTQSSITPTFTSTKTSNWVCVSAAYEQAGGGGGGSGTGVLMAPFGGSLPLNNLATGQPLQLP